MVNPIRYARLDVEDGRDHTEGLSRRCKVFSATCSIFGMLLLGPAIVTISRLSQGICSLHKFNLDPYFDQPSHPEANITVPGNKITVPGVNITGIKKTANYCNPVISTPDLALIPIVAQSVLNESPPDDLRRSRFILSSGDRTHIDTIRNIHERLNVEYLFTKMIQVLKDERWTVGGSLPLDAIEEIFYCDLTVEMVEKFFKSLQFDLMVTQEVSRLGYCPHPAKTSNSINTLVLPVARYSPNLDWYDEVRYTIVALQHISNYLRSIFTAADARINCAYSMSGLSTEECPINAGYTLFENKIIPFIHWEWLNVGKKYRHEISRSTFIRWNIGSLFYPKVQGHYQWKDDLCGDDLVQLKDSICDPSLYGSSSCEYFEPVKALFGKGVMHLLYPDRAYFEFVDTSPNSLQTETKRLVLKLLDKTQSHYFTGNATTYSRRQYWNLTNFQINFCEIAVRSLVEAAAHLKQAALNIAAKSPDDYLLTPPHEVERSLYQIIETSLRWLELDPLERFVHLSCLLDKGSFEQIMSKVGRLKIINETTLFNTTISSFQYIVY